MPRVPKDKNQPAKAPVEPEPQDAKALEDQLAELKAKQAELQKKVKANQPAAPKESTPLPEDGLASEVSDEEVARAQILRDPFDSRNSLKILRNPPGRRLRWLSHTYRETRNMRGWTPVRYDDPIGRELGKYIGEIPPRRMDGTANLDQVVRRGDVFLAWIDEGIWLARQVRRERRAAERISSHRSKIQQAIGEHGATFGEGLQDDAERRFQEVRNAPGFVSPDESAYRNRARGDVDDPAQRVAGRNMFEEVAEDEE